MSEKQLADVVERTITPLMKAQAIPEWPWPSFIRASHTILLSVKQTLRRISPSRRKTLFELGSVGKNLHRRALGGDAIGRKEISLADPVTKYWPELTGKQWQGIRLLDSATYTAGDCRCRYRMMSPITPLMLRFYQSCSQSGPWYHARLYANTSIGLFGSLAVKPSGMRRTGHGGAVFKPETQPYVDKRSTR